MESVLWSIMLRYLKLEIGTRLVIGNMAALVLHEGKIKNGKVLASRNHRYENVAKGLYININ